MSDIREVPFDFLETALPFFVARETETADVDASGIWANPTEGVTPEEYECLKGEMTGWSPAVSGLGGHNISFSAALRLWRAGCNATQVLELLAIAPAEPPWGESELRHKVEEAFKTTTADSTIGTQRPGDEFDEVPTEETQATEADTELLVWSMDQVQEKEVDWLWDSRIPIGELTILSGHAGRMKSTITLDWARCITTGADWPDGQPCKQGSVILICAEDDKSYTIAPRLRVSGADLSRVKLLEGAFQIDKKTRKKVLQRFNFHNIESLHKALSQLPDCRMIVIDPVGSYTGAKTDSDKENQVREIIDPLVKLCRKHHVAGVCVAHDGKSPRSHADHAVLGSVAWTAAARSVIHVLEVPGDKTKSWFVPGKCNLCMAPKGLIYAAKEVEPKLARIEWLGELDMNANEALAAAAVFGKGQSGPAPEARNACEDFLRAYLADGKKKSTDVLEAAKAHFFTPDMLRRARERICVTTHPEIPGPWYVELKDPDEFCEVPDDESQPISNPEENNQ